MHSTVCTKQAHDALWLLCTSSLTWSRPSSLLTWPIQSPFQLASLTSFCLQLPQHGQGYLIVSLPHLQLFLSLLLTRACRLLPPFSHTLPTLTLPPAMMKSSKAPPLPAPGRCYPDPQLEYSWVLLPPSYSPFRRDPPHSGLSLTTSTPPNSVLSAPVSTKANLALCNYLAC